ncbi:MAG TPA: hypothetical protein VFC46_14455 [Humisphaera sp.]|nr:hypothetical protein [Humisphaera sp.]
MASGSAVARADDMRRDQVNAATAQAFDSLRHEVLAIHLANDLTVGAFLDRCRANDQMDATLKGAEQIGGTRWLDDQTVQVRLEIHGSDIARTIGEIAGKNSALLPAPLHVLRERLKKDMSRRTYSALGTCTAAAVASFLRPDPSQIAWRSVGDADRQAAIEAARHNAIDRVIDSLRTVEWNNGKRHLADAIAVPMVVDSLRQWLSARPITSIEFRDDLEVRISLAASPADLWPLLAEVLTKQSAVSPPHDAKEWDALRHQVHVRLATASGAALARATVPGAGLPAPVVQRQPPQWAGTLADAEGVSASVGGNKLKTARAAENIAMTQLRARVEALSFDSNTTLGEAARKDPRIAQALDRGMIAARISKVDYDSPVTGAVRVKMTLNLESVWRELSK